MREGRHYAASTWGPDMISIKPMGTRTSIIMIDAKCDRCGRILSYVTEDLDTAIYDMIHRHGWILDPRNGGKCVCRRCIA